MASHGPMPGIESLNNITDHAHAHAHEPQLSPIEKSFTSLIQQYLTLLLHSNATFLAERMVAHNPTPHATYLLAMCHYRSGSPKRARSILIDAGLSNYKDDLGHGQGSGSTNVNMTNSSTGTTSSDCIMYLLAKCCVDLGLFNEAEEYLLQQAQLDYASFKKQQRKEHTNVNAISNTNADESRKVIPDFEEWLQSLDPTENPNPVPNGAAGFHLLGVICRRTMRKEKARIYFQLALRLDPMLWISYAALCEMGAAVPNSLGASGIDNENSKEDGPMGGSGFDNSNGIDPASIFGVIPKALTIIPTAQGGYGTVESLEEVKVEKEEFLRRARENASPFSLTNSPILGAADDTGVVDMSMNLNMGGMDHSMINSTMQHHDMSVGGLPGRLSFGATPMNHPDMDRAGFESLHGKSLFQGNLSTIRKPGGNRNGNRVRRSSTGLPSAALFGTPSVNLSSAYTPRNILEEDKTVLRRAKQVAARRYYEPSPETTPPNRIRTMVVPHSSLKLTRKKTRRRFVEHEYDEKYDDDSVRFQLGDVAVGDDRQKRFLFDHSMDATGVNASVAMTAEKELNLRKAPTSRKKASRGNREEVKENTATDTNAENRSSSDGEDGGVQFILELLCTFGAAQRLLCAFRCKEAIQILHTLPHSQFQTGWVQHQIGRAYFYSVDYANAQRALETMQEVEPHRMKGLELLSTTLYLLKKEVELSNLAQRVVDFDRMSPETWCVVGNCFSLQKEHKTALNFFRRSIQLDPSFTYAHTLSGHEYVANEDFDHAVASFRHAITVDERHYNAWNGIGEIFFRQEKYDLAEQHFQKALSINPQGSVIRCNLGQAQHASGKHHLALETLALVDQRNPQAQFQRANILISMDRLSEALKELEKVRDTAPREASIHFAMGRVLKKLGKPEKAMRCFLTALDLDPKENTLIKSAIDRLDEPDMDEDVSAF